MTRSKIKHGVSFGAYPQLAMAIAHNCIASVFAAHGCDCIVTSALDGEHSKNSLHYEGRALDYRTRHVPRKDILQDIVREIAEALGPEFDVVLEATHLHVEYDPK